MAKLIPVNPVRGDSLLARLLGPSIADRMAADTGRLYRELAKRHRASVFADPHLVARLAARVAADLPDPVPPALAAAVKRAARALVTLEAELFNLPTPPMAASLLAGSQFRTLLRQRHAFLEHHDPLIAAWLDALSHAIAAIVAALPRLPTAPTALTIEAPLSAMIEHPVELAANRLDRLLSFATDPANADAPIVPGARLADLLRDNLLRTSKLSLETAQRHPERLRFPEADTGPPTEILARTVTGTPFAALLATTVPIPVPHRLRFEHTHILARIGYGKTQAMQKMILDDVDDPARPAVVVIDSQGDMINTLSRLARFDPAHDDRLIVVDPTDTAFPLRLNMFDIDRARLARMPLGHREEFLAGVIELYEYIFGALLGADLTGKQSVVFRMLAQLLLAIPDATIQTLIRLLDDPTPFLPHITSLPPTTRLFLTDHLFTDRQYGETRRQILRRLFHVLSNPVFERMFAHPRNGLDIKAALDSGKILLINTAKARLKSDWSAIFGRYMIALVMQAVLARAAEPEARRRSAFVYIDEAHEYFDQPIDTLLLQARKYKIGLVLAHQTIDQLRTGGLKASVMGMPALRFTGELSAADAASLAPEMRTSAEFLMSMRKRHAGAEFACHVRSLTPAALKITLPFLTAERAPRMTDAAYARLLARVRAQVAIPLARLTPARESIRPISQPDPFADRY